MWNSQARAPAGPVDADDERGKRERPARPACAARCRGQRADAGPSRARTTSASSPTSGREEDPGLPRVGAREDERAMGGAAAPSAAPAEPRHGPWLIEPAQPLGPRDPAAFAGEVDRRTNSCVSPSRRSCRRAPAARRTRRDRPPCRRTRASRGAARANRSAARPGRRSRRAAGVPEPWSSDTPRSSARLRARAPRAAPRAGALAA